MQDNNKNTYCTESTAYSRKLQYNYNALISKASELSCADVHMLETTRKYPYVYWKFATWYILREQGATYTSIATVAKKNHATVINGITRIDDALKYNADPTGKKIYNKLKKAFTEVPPNNVISTTRTSIVEWLNTVTMDHETMNKLLSTISTLSV